MNVARLGDLHVMTLRTRDFTQAHEWTPLLTCPFRVVVLL